MSDRYSRPMYIAVDFDGTLCSHKFPDIGSPNFALISTVKRLKKDGHKIILWTCREDIPEGNYLTQAIEWCRDFFELEFDFINENPDCDFGHPEKVRKIVADIYIDDKVFNPIGCWIGDMHNLFLDLNQYIREGRHGVRLNP